jgi:DNA-binding Lrp family transcriptional regulator
MQASERDDRLATATAGSQAAPPAEIADSPSGRLTTPLDAIDARIVAILRQDGRVSMRTLAERAHVSRANAYTRVDRLLRRGVVRGFTARVDHERMGLATSAYITVKIQQNSWRSLRDRVKALPQVEHIALVGGDFDVLLLVRTESNAALRDLVLVELQGMPEVLSTRTMLVFEELHGGADA